MNRDFQRGKHVFTFCLAQFLYLVPDMQKGSGVAMTFVALARNGITILSLLAGIALWDEFLTSEQLRDHSSIQQRP